MNKKTTVPFRGTDEQKRKLLAVISELKDEKGALMPIMQHAQEIYGYLPDRGSEDHRRRYGRNPDE